ncbi:MurR/RpiR family transcriptional regulator [Candidatus Stoquefichus massiliensis]|uniref:MurR/RpiR family transcriptional regulator n=1 Tax=Candidatus Stoquefichus massiliensis TaxID=1470350 RepID=UPI000486FED8|nr:MurR/RpiR family transcriptional regulator [Candidatus Stoquefichus massiliensis]
MKSLFYRLIIFLDTAQENDTNYNIAWFMANNFYRIANMRISELAAECFVSPATISRFCRALGYENFAHLKQECYTFHSNDKKFNNLINIPLETMKNDPSRATREYVEQVIHYISDLPQMLDWKEIDETLRLIHDCDSVAFFGTQFSQSAALHFQTDLLMLEKFTMAYMDSSRQLDCAKELTSDSVAIIMTVNGYFTGSSFKILQYIKKSGCKVVLMTCNPELDIKIPVDHKVLLGNSRNRKTGKHSLLTAVELMSLRYYCLYYPSIQELKGHIL